MYKLDIICCLLTIVFFVLFFKFCAKFCAKYYRIESITRTKLNKTLICIWFIWFFFLNCIMLSHSGSEKEMINKFFPLFWTPHRKLSLSTNCIEKIANLNGLSECRANTDTKSVCVFVCVCLKVFWCCLFRSRPTENLTILSLGRNNIKALSGLVSSWPIVRKLVYSCF